MTTRVPILPLLSTLFVKNDSYTQKRWEDADYDEEDDGDEDAKFMAEISRHLPTWIAVMAITMVTAFVGNTFLAVVVIRAPRRRFSPVHILILHTCLADILFAMCTILPQMAGFLTFPNFYGGDFLCRCVRYLQLIPMYASPYLLIAISVDRYVAICKPLRAYRMKHNLVHWLATGAWLASLVLASPNFVVFSFGYLDNSTILSCTDQMEPWQQKLYISFYAVSGWLIPSLTSAIFYTFVCVKVWNSDRKMVNVPSAIANASVVSTSSVLRKSPSCSVTLHKIKTVKLTMTIVACNFLLLAPFCLIHVLSTFFPALNDDFITVTSVMLVGNANSCVNPWIYLIFNFKQIYNMCVAPSYRGASNSERYRTVMLSVRSRNSTNRTHYQNCQTNAIGSKHRRRQQRRDECSEVNIPDESSSTTVRSLKPQTKNIVSNKLASSIE